MNKTRNYLFATLLSLFFILFMEIFYLHVNNSLQNKAFLEKEAFVHMSTLSNLNLAIKDNNIKRPQ